VPFQITGVSGQTLISYKKDILPKNVNAMKTQFTFIFLSNAATRILLGFVLAAGTAACVHGQGQLAGGTIAGSGSGPYVYSLIFSDAGGATSPVGSVWYAWTPGQFYLPGVPTSASTPAGWTATITANSVKYVADSSTNDIAAGQSLSGFGYQATFSPTQLAAATNSGLAVAYSGGLFSDSGNTFTVQAVPEPSGQMLLLSGMIAVWLIRRKLQTA
jgi:hypothetical protein